MSRNVQSDEGKGEEGDGDEHDVGAKAQTFTSVFTVLTPESTTKAGNVDQSESTDWYHKYRTRVTKCGDMNRSFGSSEYDIHILEKRGEWAKNVWWVKSSLMSRKEQYQGMLQAWTDAELMYRLYIISVCVEN